MANPKSCFGGILRKKLPYVYETKNNFFTYLFTIKFWEGLNPLTKYTIGFRKT